jgi:hypothetical protein
MDLNAELWIEVYVVSVIPETFPKDAKSAVGYFQARADLLDKKGDIIRVEASVSSTSANSSRDLRKRLVSMFIVDEYLCVKGLSSPKCPLFSNVAAIFPFTPDVRTRLSSAHMSDGNGTPGAYKGFDRFLKTVYCHYATDVLNRGRLMVSESKDAVLPRVSITAVVHSQVSAGYGNAPSVYKIISNNVKPELVCCI